MLLPLGLIVMCLSVVMVLASAAYAHRRADVQGMRFLQVATMAGVVALGAAALHLMARHQSLTILTMTADTLIVLAPALIGVAVSVESESRARFAVAFAAMTAMSVAVSTSVLPAHGGLIVRCIAMGAVCATCAWWAARSADLPRTPARIIGVAAALYAAYSALRAATLIVQGPDAEGGLAVFSEPGATVAAVSTVLAVCVAVQMIAVPAVRSARRRARSLTTLVVGDGVLLSSAYGRGRASDLVAELRMAARELDPFAVDIPHGVGFRRLSVARRLGETLTLAYGWRPDEIASLVDDVPDAPAISENASDAFPPREPVGVSRRGRA